MNGGNGWRGEPLADAVRASRAMRRAGEERQRAIHSAAEAKRIAEGNPSPPTLEQLARELADARSQVSAVEAVHGSATDSAKDAARVADLAGAELASSRDAVARAEADYVARVDATTADRVTAASADLRLAQLREQKARADREAADRSLETSGEALERARSEVLALERAIAQHPQTTIDRTRAACLRALEAVDALVEAAKVIDDAREEARRAGAPDRPLLAVHALLAELADRGRAPTDLGEAGELLGLTTVVSRGVAKNLPGFVGLVAAIATGAGGQRLALGAWTRTLQAMSLARTVGEQIALEAQRNRELEASFAAERERHAEEYEPPDTSEPPHRTILAPSFAEPPPPLPRVGNGAPLPGLPGRGLLDRGVAALRGAVASAMPGWTLPDAHAPQASSNGATQSPADLGAHLDRHMGGPRR
ncbi:MAG: hypothetical protein ACLQBL_07925 [Polyangiaceae bacterium]